MLLKDSSLFLRRLVLTGLPGGCSLINLLWVPVLFLGSCQPIKKPAGQSITSYTITKVDGKYLVRTPDRRLIFPLGMNHLNIHELQQARSDMQDLGEAELNEVLYDSLMGWGFNSSGYDRVEGLNSRFDLYHYDKKEILSLASYHGEPNYVDVFDSVVIKKFEEMIAPLSRYNEDDNVIGLMYSDIPMYVPRAHRNWVSFYRQLPWDAPGRNVYNTFISEKYAGDIAMFNAIYRESIPGADQLDQARYQNIVPYDSVMLSDDAAFMSVIYEQYLGTIFRFHREYAPKKLFVGDVFNKVDWTEDMMRIAGRYVDAIALQPSMEIVFDIANFAKVHDLSQKPIIVSDHKVSFEEAGYSNIQGLEVPTQRQAGISYENYLNACFETPYVIGFNRCMFKSKFRPGGVLKQGLIDYHGNPYDTLIYHVKKANEKINQQIEMMNSARSTSG